MKKKRCLRIQALVLVLLMILTTFVISSPQVLADGIIAGDEESTEIVADNNSTSANEDVESVPSTNSPEQQKDLDRVATETEINNISSESGNMAGKETDTIPADEADIILTDKTDIFPPDESSGLTDEPTVETDINYVESPSEQTLDQVNEWNRHLQMTKYLKHKILFPIQ